MNPEAAAPLSPAFALIILAVVGVVAFVLVKARLKRYKEEAAPQAEPAPEAAAVPVAGQPTALPAEPAPPSSAPEPAPRPKVVVATVPPAPRPAPAAVVQVGAYKMAAPVELWFGELRVAVRAGSNTERRFQRYASVLLEELAAAEGRSTNRAHD